MADTETNLADRSGSLIESHKGYDPRIVSFYFAIAALLLVLAGGLAYQQLKQLDLHAKRERQQTQRRILLPGPRGVIYDRNHVPLVTNKYRWSVVLHLDELKAEFNREQERIRTNYKAISPKDIPSLTQRLQIARVSVAQRYLDQVGRILQRPLTIDANALRNHFRRQLLLPFTLVDGLSDADYARLVENLPVDSPVEVSPVVTRTYPFGSAAAHTLGYVRAAAEVEDDDDFPGDRLRTFRGKETAGYNGLEQQYDDTLRGETGGSIYRVDPSGFKIKPLEEQKPRIGEDLVTSLDIDLQIAAEDALLGRTQTGETTMPEVRGAAVAIDVATGEVLVMASKPDYDLNEFSPNATQAVVDQMNASSAWNNLALNGLYPPGSTFKILTTIAALRNGAIKTDEPIVFCDGQTLVGNRVYRCDVGHGHHGNVLLPEAIAKSCDIYYYEAGRLTTPEKIAAEGRRFHLDRPTGIDLPHETKAMIIPDPAWKERQNETWGPGDTANTAIGQGAVRVTVLEMACFAASVARDEVYTQPTLVHRADAPRQRHEKIGLTAAQRAAIIEGMEGAVTYGSAKTIDLPALRIPGVSIAGKTGTAQVPGRKNVAWFICFAPSRNPEIAVAVAVEGDTPGEDFYGGAYAAPIASAVLRKYFQKKVATARPAAAVKLN
jgi:penicillin-binding protein 2